MISFCNPGVLGTEAEFNKYYARPILNAREPDEADSAKKLGQERSTELSVFVNQFVIRRTNALLSAHLPPKVRRCSDITLALVRAQGA
jgi:DNA repair and recombination RAD54-like protein